MNEHAEKHVGQSGFYGFKAMFWSFLYVAWTTESNTMELDDENSLFNVSSKATKHQGKENKQDKAQEK